LAACDAAAWACVAACAPDCPATDDCPEPAALPCDCALCVMQNPTNTIPAKNETRILFIKSSSLELEMYFVTNPKMQESTPRFRNLYQQVLKSR
jgi:hypothetical protein